jgi:hypothetical protein
MVQAESVSLKKDGHTLCHPSYGYAQETSIELDDYTEVGTLNGTLPRAMKSFPKEPLSRTMRRLGRSS